MWKFLNSRLLVLPLIFVAGTSLQAEERIELGELECFVDAGTGFIIGSQKDISCVFTSFQSEDIIDNYFGVINKIGLDIGSTEESYIKWIVVAPTQSQLTKGFLH